MARVRSSAGSTANQQFFFSRFGCPFDLFTDLVQISRVSYLNDSVSFGEFTLLFRRNANGQEERYYRTVMNASIFFSEFSG